MTDSKTPRTSKAASAAPAKGTGTEVKPDPAGSDQGGALPATTDPAGVTDQARKQPADGAPKPGGTAKKDRTPDGDPGINANITDLPGHAAGIGKGAELDPDDPGINASVVS
jgi:hypothetical protein